MKAARLFDPGEMRLADEPAPEPGPDEVTLKITAVGLRGFDLHWFHEEQIGDVRLDRPPVHPSIPAGKNSRSSCHRGAA